MYMGSYSQLLSEFCNSWFDDNVDAEEPQIACTFEFHNNS